ncbi:MAG: flagellar biosynthetic protein FliR [Thermoguttaceae bacterium]|jgi:flagellar biosynthetic protein FliR
MDWLRQIDVEKLLVFSLVLTRTSGLLATAPVYGTQDVPMTVRALLSVILAALVMPTQWGATLPGGDTMLQYLALAGSELLVGVCLGLGVVMLLSGVQIAGELMSRIGGLSLSDVFDPTFNDNTPLFSRLLVLVATAVFVAMGGHRVLMAGLLDTFQSIPPGSGVAMLLGSGNSGGPDAGLLPSVANLLVTLVAESFQLGVRISVPVVTAVLLATLVLGLISRTLPQLNILVVGFGLNAMLTFGVFSLSMGAIAMAFQAEIEPTLQAVFQVLRLPWPGFGVGS